jgi:hypothetical protein
MHHAGEKGYIESFYGKMRDESIGRPDLYVIELNKP